jgi:hypothetical protein
MSIPKLSAHNHGPSSRKSLLAQGCVITSPQVPYPHSLYTLPTHPLSQRCFSYTSPHNTRSNHGTFITLSPQKNKKKNPQRDRILRIFPNFQTSKLRKHLARARENREGTQLRSASTRLWLNFGSELLFRQDLFTS